MLRRDILICGSFPLRNFRGQRFAIKSYTSNCVLQSTLKLKYRFVMVRIRAIGSTRQVLRNAFIHQLLITTLSIALCLIASLIIIIMRGAMLLMTRRCTRPSKYRTYLRQKTSSTSPERRGFVDEGRLKRCVESTLRLQSFNNVACPSYFRSSQSAMSPLTINAMPTIREEHKKSSLKK